MVKHLAKADPEMQSHVIVIERMAIAVAEDASHAVELHPVTVKVNAPLRAAQLVMPLTPDQLRRLNGLPVKVAPKVRLLMQRGIDARAKREVRASLNPFPQDSNKYLWLACEQLLGIGFNRVELKQAFVDSLGFSPATAASHVSNTLSVFTALEIIEPAPGGRFKRIQS